MKIDPLDISGAWVCASPQFADDRGVFLEWFRGDELAAATGRRFDVVQANHSVSRRGTVRGVHFADVPPSQAKFVTCARGAVLDVVVDIRVGSPTYGASAAVVLDDVDRRALFIAEGLGHAFCALSEESSVIYLTSSVYNPAREHAVHAFDAALALPWPDDLPLLLSPRDEAAPTLAEAEASGLLPRFDDCVDFYSSLDPDRGAG